MSRHQNQPPSWIGYCDIGVGMRFGGHFEFWPKEKVSRNFWEVHGAYFH